MSKPVIYVFVNKSLNMSGGKLAAQAVHAALMVAFSNRMSPHSWTSSIHRTVLIMEARDENHIRNIQDYLIERVVFCQMIIDEGVNEIEPITITALATGILDKDDIDTDEIMSSFKLYKDGKHKRRK